MKSFDEHSFSKRVDRLLAEAAADAAEVQQLTSLTNSQSDDRDDSNSHPNPHHHSSRFPNTSYAAEHAAASSVSPIPSLIAIRDKLLNRGSGYGEGEEGRAFGGAETMSSRSPIQLPSSPSARATEHPGSPTLFATLAHPMEDSGGNLNDLGWSLGEAVDAAPYRPGPEEDTSREGWKFAFTPPTGSYEPVPHDFSHAGSERLAMGGKPSESPVSDEQVIMLLNNLEKEVEHSHLYSQKMEREEADTVWTAPYSPTKRSFDRSQDRAKPRGKGGAVGGPARRGGVGSGSKRASSPAASALSGARGSAASAAARSSGGGRKTKAPTAFVPSSHTPMKSSPPPARPLSAPRAARRRSGSPTLLTAARVRSPGATSPGNGITPRTFAAESQHLSEMMDKSRVSASQKDNKKTPNVAKLQATIASQELRLKGQTETIHALERAVKAKETAIKVLESEMHNRTDAVRSAQASVVMASATARRLGEETSKSSALMASRKRADELSARVAMLESQLKDEKRVEARARERCTSVLTTLKATEEERDNAVKELEKRKKVSATAATTIKALHKQVKSLEKTVEKQAHLEVEVERLTERLAEMEALREQKRQGDEANRFHKEENARLSTAAQTSEARAQDLEHQLARLQVDLSESNIRLQTAREAQTGAEEEKAKMERHARVMESTCERLRDQLREHTDRVRKEVSDKRWQNAKEKAREASRGLRRGVESEEETEDDGGRLYSGRKPSPSGYSIYSEITEATPAAAVRSWDQIGVGYIGRTDSSFTTPAVRGGSRWAPDNETSAARLSEETQPSVSEIQPDNNETFSEADDLPGSASRRLDELRNRYSKLKEKLATG